MKADFQYSTDFYAINARELSHSCMHLLCLAGEGSFVFHEHCYHIARNDLVVIPMPNCISNLAAHPDLQVEWFAADYKFLQNLLPSNNYSIGGSISHRHNTCSTTSTNCATEWTTSTTSSTANSWEASVLQ